MSFDKRPILLLDFNGTIHAYSRGYQDKGEFYDPPTDGFKAWATEAQKEFRLVIWPARAKTPSELQRVHKWMRKHGLGGLDYDLTTSTPIGVKCKIDDRALHFTGTWADFPMERLRNFQTWSGR